MDEYTRVMRYLPLIKQELANRPMDAAFLDTVFHSTEFRALLKLYDYYRKDRLPEGADSNSAQVATKLAQSLAAVDSKEANELSSLLATPRFQAMLAAQDVMARWQAVGVVETPPGALVVRLQKSSVPLGATIRRVRSGGRSKIVFARVLIGGAADRTGKIHPGDEIIEVDGVDVVNGTVDNVIEIMKRAVNEVFVKILPNSEKMEEDVPHSSYMWIRTLFSYDPQDESWLPRRDGLAFCRGDILRITSRDNPQWWLAKIEGSDQVGYIPGKDLMDKAPGRGTPEGMDRQDSEGSVTLSLPSLQKGTSYARAIGQEGSSPRGAPAFEEVLLINPHLKRKRVLVLIGPSGVGRHALKKYLLNTLPTVYGSTVPHTTRPARDGEQHGREYYFVSRAEMKADIVAKKFIEYGEYQGNYYGTSVQSIVDVIDAGRVCVLDMMPKALKLVRTPQLQPFVVFVRPPSLHRLRATRGNLFADAKLQKMISTAAKYEANYSHFFDKVLINDEFASTCNDLHFIVQQYCSQPHWVPRAWAEHGPPGSPMP
eukprot:m.157751 g.157751  ORF g.157751 m.157751 type:complete len:541 (+) comp20864_c0_seq1:40-1662(+)